MNIAAFDTSAKTASVAIAADERILAEFSVSAGLTHSQTLMPMLLAVLDSCSLALSDMDCFAVSSGPGSFTGLRIGIGAVKGLAAGLCKPCIGVSTLESLCYNLSDTDGIHCAVMDARCRQVYTATFCGRTRLTEDEACSIDALCEALSRYEEPVTLVGDGAALCYDAMHPHLPSLRIASPINRYQRAASVALCAQAHLSEAVSAAALTPSYLRKPQAERDRLAKLRQMEE